jgi:hypothetical protein
MKMQLTTNPLITSEEMETSVMGMDSSGMDQACYFLRDKIYSDKVGAVVREYITNALDEHVKYNIDLPVRVSLTSKEFIVRDFAKGLSENDVREVFGMYFKSTKRSNNAQSGMFGLGSKAAHCYTDSFYVKSYFEGVCTLYTAVLGGGKNGVPVGQIMKISEEPTTESGLEITVEYNSTDYSAFNNKIKYIVYTCSKNVEYTNVSEHTVVPLTPVEVLEKKGFIFKLYDFSTIYSAPNNVYFKMGEITYKVVNIENFLGKNTQHVSLPLHHSLVVEIPIGKMSLPISRESFEDTPANSRVFEELKNVLNEIYEEEFSDKKDLGIDELLSSKSERTISGKFFVTHKSVLYPNLYPLLVNLFVTNSVKPLCELDNKKVVCLIPNKESSDYWIDKFCDHSNTKDNSYYYINENWIDKITDSSVLEKLKNYFVFKKVKSTFFGWPKDKTEKNISNFSAKIYTNQGSYYRENFAGTALEIHNYMRKKYNLAEAKDINEAKEQNAKFIWSDSFKIFNSFTIRKHGSACECVWTQSKTILDYLKELGWFVYTSPEYAQTLAEITKKEKERKALESMKDDISISFLETNAKEKIIQKISKNKKHLKKASLILQKIKSENSLRGVIFNTLQREGTSYWFKNYISRKDLRKILVLK